MKKKQQEAEAGVNTSKIDQLVGLKVELRAANNATREGALTADGAKTVLKALGKH